MPRKKQSKAQPDPGRKPWEIPVGGGEYGIDLDVYFSMLEKEVGYSLVAYDKEEDSIVYGGDLIEMLEGENESNASKRGTEEIPPFTVEQEEKLRAAEEELGYRLVAYHRGSDAVMFGGDLLDELAAK